ncbi:MbtH family NRPS accessory protein [Kitasatospora purpeofusca]|uniref:MbtH family NRPS accessory protein n=1 Tax=Kitasatospora purpeofusca TaxID=67352 RepID=A0ABZ1UAU9_9ACTN|nr:MbtH family NRPS accessory protein [Kitasatospora purpeofusca]
MRWTVLVNDQQQHALYPADRPAPAGWHPTGFTGTEESCAAHVDATWPDIRPLPPRAQRS